MKQVVESFLHYTPWTSLAMAYMEFLRRALFTLAVTFPFNLIALLAFVATGWKAVRGNRTEVLKMVGSAKGQVSAGRENLVILTHMRKDIKDKLRRARVELVEDQKRKLDLQIWRQLEAQQEKIYEQIEKDLNRGDEPLREQQFILEKDIDLLTQQQASFIDS